MAQTVGAGFRFDQIACDDSADRSRPLLAIGAEEGGVRG